MVYGEKEQIEFGWARSNLNNSLRGVLRVCLEVSEGGVKLQGVMWVKEDILGGVLKVW